MPVRRALDPTWVQHVWDSIRYANAQRQMADMSRIVKYLQRIDEVTQEQGEICVKQCVQDGLIFLMPKVHAKGAQVGVQVDSYKIPSKEIEMRTDDGKDWYCFECHLAGEVNACRLCHRVFHHECGVKAQKRQEKSTLPLSLGSTNGNSDSEGSRNSSVSRDTSEHREPAEEKTSVNNTTDDDMQVVKDPKQDTVINLDESEPQIQLVDETKKDETVTYDQTLCSICNACRMDPDLKLDKEELNHLLSFVHNRIKSWIPSFIADKMAPEEKPEWHSEAEVRWRCKLLFYQPMDMGLIDMKLRTLEYSRMSEFKGDVLTVQHNVAIFHGIESQEFGASEYMVQDCIHDLTELVNCADCYKHSNEKINSKWFCLPCRNPHKLVWAKQKGYPYWPAKILRETGDSLDVRFFGGKYERSILPKNQTKPITTNVNSLKIKKSAAFTRALEELSLHRKLLSDPKEAEKIRQKKAPSKEDTLAAPQLLAKRKLTPNDAPRDVYDIDDSLSDPDYATPDKYVPKRRKNTLAPPVDTKIEHTPRRKSNTSVSSPQKKSGALEIISDSDNDDFESKEESDKDFDGNKSCEVSQAEVSSSTEQVNTNNLDAFTTSQTDGNMPQTERQYCEAVEKTRRKLEMSQDKKQLIKIALEYMQAEIDKINNERDEYVRKLFESHQQQISETKKKQWCYNCEQDAIYHCCWNTAYCSPTCQQQHWQAEHKKVCRRKR